MADKKANAEKNEAPEGAKVEAVETKGVDTYSADEIVAAADKLVKGVKPYLAAAALKQTAKKRFTKAEAITIIKEFANRKVEK